MENDDVIEMNDDGSFDLPQPKLPSLDLFKTEHIDGKTKAKDAKQADLIADITRLIESVQPGNHKVLTSAESDFLYIVCHLKGEEVVRSVHATEKSLLIAFEGNNCICK